MVIEVILAYYIWGRHVCYNLVGKYR